MRLISTIDDQVRGTALSAALTNQGIHNQIDVVKDADWGSAGYGTVTCRIWVIDEDQVEQAMKIAHDFMQNPHDNRPVISTEKKPPHIQIKPPPFKLAAARRDDQQSLGVVNIAILFICCLLFMIQQVTAPEIKQLPASIPYGPVITPPVNKELLYDYPQAFTIIDKIVSAYGIGQLQIPTQKPAEVLLEQFRNTPYWKGIYTPAVAYFKSGDTSAFKDDVPMFEKIREGEVWRLFTPALLHYDWLHILFNMLWVIVLGRQLESKLGGLRYFLFIIMTGIATNTAQYLMSGSEFLGFSGIICAMLSFTWMRQRLAAWEGFRLEKSTMGFMMFFLFTVLAIQVISFVMEVYGQSPIATGIANTAHMTGLASGFLLGTFSWKR